MSELIIAALFGLLGGAIRALMGILKHYKINKKAKFKFTYLWITLIISGLRGAVTSTSLTTNHLINLVVGYAGIDFLESLMKLTIKKN